MLLLILIALVLWALVSVPVALLVAGILKLGEGKPESDGVEDEIVSEDPAPALAISA